jgi:antitoxin component YwqK of YwqJK toxin-antitoxin module
MKKILLLLCSLILIGCGGQTHEDGPFRWYYENGNIRTEGTYKNDIMVGVMKEYNEDGRLEKKVTRDNRGVINGPHIQYYLAPKYKNNDGDRLESTRVDEDIEGPAVYYWADGAREERTYVNNIVEGPAVYYWADGNKSDRRESTYVNGIEEGPAVTYYVNGDKREFTYVNGKMHGDAVYTYRNGRTDQERYENGKKVYDSATVKSSSRSSSYSSSSSSQKGRYNLRGDISFSIVVSGSGDILEYSGFSDVYGVQGNVSGTIKNNTLYEDGVMGIGSIDRNGKWIKYDGHIIYK